LFLFLEGDDVVLDERVVALVRVNGETVMVMTDGGPRVTAFTPGTVGRRGERFWDDAARWRERFR
jgi:hypothetical protein